MSTEVKNNVENKQDEDQQQPKTFAKVSQKMLLDALQAGDIHPDDYAFNLDSGSAYRKRRAIARLLGKPDNLVYQFTKDIGYKNFNTLCTLEETKEMYDLWESHMKSKRTMDIMARIF